MTLIIVVLIGFGVGYWWRGTRPSHKASEGEGSLDNVNAEADRRKEEGKGKIMEALRQQGEITNDQVQKLLGFSDATATRYLEELEQEGKITQHGETGRGTIYKLE